MDESVTGGIPGLKDKNTLPDLGVKIPESKEQAEILYRSIVDVVSSLQKPENYSGFEQVVVEMFEAFGIDESSNSKDKEANRFRWKRVYDHYQQLKDIKTAQISSDIDIRGAKSSYANVMFDQVKVFGCLPATLVSPGACSLTDNIVGISEDRPFFPEKNFYTVFERTIGVSPTATRSFQRIPGSEFKNKKVFLVSNGKHSQLPLNVYKKII